MHQKIYRALFSLTLGALLSSPARAQERAPTKPDSAMVQAQIDEAKKIAGSFWAPEEKFLCEDSRTFNGRSTPAADPGPFKMFDNLYAIPGQYSVGNGVVYVIPTTAGLIMIDSGHAKDVEPVVIAGVKTLGFDPANIKIVIITHGHEDHVGGARLLQERYGAHIVLSAQDWDFIYRPAAAGAPAQPAPPKRDMVAAEGQPITLGEETITPVFVPGHTPGTIGLIFPVKDAGKTHMVGEFGGGFIIWAQYTDETGAQFVQSLKHFEQWTKKMKVDVEIANHPGVWDNFPTKLAALKARKAGDPNPFVVGPENYDKFMRILAVCAQASLDRRKE